MFEKGFLQDVRHTLWEIAGMIFQTGSRACRLQKAFFKHILERGQKELFEKYMTNFASRIPVCISACLLFPVLRS